jgi:glycogen debranching enzyme
VFDQRFTAARMARDYVDVYERVIERARPADREGRGLKAVDEVIRVQDQYYILSTSARVDDRSLVLKNGDAFSLVDRFGDIDSTSRPELGVYCQDTRFLSRLTLRLEGARLLLLSSTIKKDNSAVTVDLTNPDLERDGTVIVPRGTVHVFRSSVLWEAVYYHRLRFHNYGRTACPFLRPRPRRGLRRPLRGSRHASRAEGQALPIEMLGNELVFAYEGWTDGGAARGRARQPPESCTGSRLVSGSNSIRHGGQSWTRGLLRAG